MEEYVGYYIDICAKMFLIQKGENMKNLIKIIALIVMLFNFNNIMCFAQTAVQDADVPLETSETVSYTKLKTPVLLVDNPVLYMNKNVQFNAKFNKFSSLGLDYKPALRESKTYIGILINRDDTEYTIPLSELKMFIKRKEAEKLTDIETGDEIQVKGTVFSSALGDPWLDVTEIKILTVKENKNKEKEKTTDTKK